MACQFLEAMCGGGADAQISKFELRPCPRHFESARHGSRTASHFSISANSASRDAAVSVRKEISARSRASRPTLHRRLKIGSSTAPTDPVNSRRSASGDAARIASTQKQRSIRFPLNAPRSANDQMRGPDLRILRSARPAMRNQRIFTQCLGHDEHFRECGMRCIRAMRSQRQFHIAGQFDLPAAQQPIGERQSPQLHFIFRGDRHIHRRFDAQDTALELCAIRREAYGIASQPPFPTG